MIQTMAFRARNVVSPTQLDALICHDGARVLGSEPVSMWLKRYLFFAGRRASIELKGVYN